MAYLRLSPHVFLIILVFGFIESVWAEHGETKNTEFQDVQDKDKVVSASSDDNDLYTVLTPPMTVVVLYGLVFVLFGISWFPWYIGLRQRRSAESRNQGISNKAVSVDAIESTDGTYELTTVM
ncbi:uncharacterized protein LOC144351300 [Saccoglossus kowalevskii]